MLKDMLIVFLGIAAGIFLYFVQYSPLDPIVLENGVPLEYPDSIIFENFELSKNYDLGKPEDILLDHSGKFFFTGTHDGYLVLVNLETGEKENVLTPLDFRNNSFPNPEEVEIYCNGDMFHEARCGRVLGLSFSSSDPDVLLIANAYTGIFAYHVGKKKLRTLVSGDGLFFNSLLEAPDGYVYYTLSHPTFQRYQFIYALLDNKPKGKLWKVRLNSPKDPEIVIDSLTFPNGVVLSKNKKYMFIAETTTRSLLKYEFETSNISVVNDNLPLHPDNLRFDEESEKIITCGLQNQFLVDWILRNPNFVKWMTRSPKFVHIPILYYLVKLGGMGVEIDANTGEVTRILRDVNSEVFHFCTNLEKIGEEGEYIMGSVLKDSARIFKIRDKS